jgi:hypothetical protein
MSRGAFTAKKNARNSFEEGYEEIAKYAKSRNTEYEKLDGKYSVGRNTLTIRFKLFYSDGSTYLLKEEALAELRTLKELLDLGILTQEEFDMKANQLKRAFLD